MLGDGAAEAGWMCCELGDGAAEAGWMCCEGE